MHSNLVHTCVRIQYLQHAHYVLMWGVTGGHKIVLNWKLMRWNPWEANYHCTNSHVFCTIGSFEYTVLVLGSKTVTDIQLMQ